MWRFSRVHPTMKMSNHVEPMVFPQKIASKSTSSSNGTKSLESTAAFTMGPVNIFVSPEKTWGGTQLGAVGHPTSGGFSGEIFVSSHGKLFL